MSEGKRQFRFSYKAFAYSSSYCKCKPGYKLGSNKAELRVESPEKEISDECRVYMGKRGS